MTDRLVIADGQSEPTPAGFAARDVALPPASSATGRRALGQRARATRGLVVGAQRAPRPDHCASHEGQRGDRGNSRGITRARSRRACDGRGPVSRADHGRAGRRYATVRAAACSRGGSLTFARASRDSRARSRRAMPTRSGTAMGRLMGGGVGLACASAPGRCGPAEGGAACRRLHAQRGDPEQRPAEEWDARRPAGDPGVTSGGGVPGGLAERQRW